MSNRAVDLLNMPDENNSKPHKRLKTRSRTCDKNVERELATFANNLNGHIGMDTVTANGFEFFTRFAYCQALLYKAWVEASDRLASKMTESTNHERNNNSKEELTSLYIDTFEEIYTDLLRSPEFASSLGKLLNSLMGCIKETDNVSGTFLNGQPKNGKSANRKRTVNGMKSP